MSQSPLKLRLLHQLLSHVLRLTSANAHLRSRPVVHRLRVVWVAVRLVNKLWVVTSVRRAIVRKLTARRVTVRKAIARKVIVRRATVRKATVRKAQTAVLKVAPRVVIVRTVRLKPFVIQP